MQTDRTKAISFTLDGESCRIVADPESTLLSILRQDLGKLGVRTGCLLGRCGSCMVLVEGRAVAACSTPMWSVESRAVGTVEGAAPGSALERVRQVFLEEQAAQCGYCVNGIMTSVAAILSGEVLPERAAILEMLDERHLCRCGAHVRMLRAIDRLLGEARERVAA